MKKKYIAICDSYVLDSCFASSKEEASLILQDKMRYEDWSESEIIENDLNVGDEVCYRTSRNELEGIITRITPIKTIGFTKVGGFIEINGVMTGSSVFQNHFIKFKKAKSE